MNSSEKALGPRESMDIHQNVFFFFGYLNPSLILWVFNSLMMMMRYSFVLVSAALHGRKPGTSKRHISFLELCLVSRDFFFSRTFQFLNFLIFGSLIMLTVLRLGANVVTLVLVLILTVSVMRRNGSCNTRVSNRNKKA